MGLSYKKLWKKLIDLNMKKTELRTLTQLSQSTLAKLAKDENVNTSVLERICASLHCDISDIVEYANEKEEINE